MTYLDRRFESLGLYVSTAASCSYLAGREARSQVVVPVHLVDATIYKQLVLLGFRRSGRHVYRPDCVSCHACTPVRVRVADFVRTRTHHRVWRRQLSLRVQSLPLRFVEAHYQLYVRYQQARHAGSEMSVDDRDRYADFILSSQVDSMLVEFLDVDNVLKIVALLDVLEDGLSAVYTFYNTDNLSESLGTYSILWQIQQCRQLNLPYLYLGYYIGASPKMSYKAAFQPLECYVDGCWVPWA